METKTKSLKELWDELKLNNPHIRIRNAAAELGVSEAELLATLCGNEVIRLKPDFKNILKEIETLGKVMALTRNDSVVHERKGVYKNASLDNEHVGLFVGDDIDLRIFFSPWAKAFAVTEKIKDSNRYSIQFFAKDGEAIHKVYLTEQSNQEVFHQIIEKYKHNNQLTNEPVEKITNEINELPDSDIDVEAFRNEWLKLKDTHDFFGLVKKHQLTRTQALRLAPLPNYAVKVNSLALRKTLQKVSEQNLDIMVFVGNKGMIQIHTGKAQKIVEYNDWLNVLDPEFNLHVKEEDLHQSWIVRKPTVDGMVTALECFNQQGEQIIQLFGKRKPGIPELDAWRKLMAEIENENKI
jgi:putative hemin transport protein